MEKTSNQTSTLAAIGAALLPFLLHPALTFARRRAEDAWPLLGRPGVTSATDIALPILSTLVGFALLIRFVKRPAWLVGVAYVPITVVAVFYVALFLFGYAWRDYP